MTDFYHNEIRPGHRLTYACRRGSKMWLATGLVTAVERDYVEVLKDDGGHTVRLRNTRNCVVKEA